MALHSHILIMAVFAVCVGAVAGVLLKDEVREQVRTGGAIAGGLVGMAIVVGWLLYFLPL
jgi:hypothetical protein